MLFLPIVKLKSLAFLFSPWIVKILRQIGWNWTLLQERRESCFGNLLFLCQISCKSFSCPSQFIWKLPGAWVLLFLWDLKSDWCQTLKTHFYYSFLYLNSWLTWGPKSSEKISQDVPIKMFWFVQGQPSREVLWWLGKSYFCRYLHWGGPGRHREGQEMQDGSGEQ